MAPASTGDALRRVDGENLWYGAFEWAVAMDFLLKALV